MSDSFETPYAVHTATCTFFLDAEGICRRVVVVPGTTRSGKPRDTSRSAQCIGAQYVAALDPTVSGMLTEMPRVGSSMLFARVDARGRISLVRTGTVTRFERQSEDPFAASDKPSMSVQTSAPVIAPSNAPPRPRPASIPAPHPYGDDDATLAKTAEYQPAPRAVAQARRPERLGDAPRPMPSSSRDSRDETDFHGAKTLRHPPVTLPPPSEAGDRYAAISRIPVPQRSEPYLTRTRSDRAPRPEAPAHPFRALLYPPVEKATRRTGER